MYISHNRHPQICFVRSELISVARQYLPVYIYIYIYGGGVGGHTTPFWGEVVVSSVVILF